MNYKLEGNNTVSRIIELIYIKAVEFIHFEKATEFDEIGLTLLRNVKTKPGGHSVKFCGLLRKPRLYHFFSGFLTNMIFNH